MIGTDYITFEPIKITVPDFGDSQENPFASHDGRGRTMIVTLRGYECREDPDRVMGRPSGLVPAGTPSQTEGIKVELMDLSLAPVRDMFEIHLKEQAFFGDDEWFNVRNTRDIELESARRCSA
jgi:hypothetical protein